MEIKKITRIKFMNISLVAQSSEDLSTFDQQRETKRDEQETRAGEGIQEWCFMRQATSASCDYSLNTKDR